MSPKNAMVLVELGRQDDVRNEHVIARDVDVPGVAPGIHIEAEASAAVTLEAATVAQGAEASARDVETQATAVAGSASWRAITLLGWLQRSGANAAGSLRRGRH